MSCRGPGWPTSIFQTCRRFASPYFACSHSHSHTRLRFLIRALDEHTPRVPLVIAARQADTPTEATGGAITAPDVAVASLRQAVDACVILYMARAPQSVYTANKQPRPWER